MKKVIAGIITGAMFAGLIVLLKRYDVAAIGPAGTSVGFSHINQRVHDVTGVNMLWYNITDYIGYFAIAVCALFALVGFVQMIKRRSLLKVDGEILALGGLFAVVIGCYVFFEKFIVNYRPIIMPDSDGKPEASFPSSHTVLILTVMVAVILIIDKYISGIGLSGFIKSACALIALITVGGRLYCGVHWFTDIVGGILLSTSLLFLFAAVVSKIEMDSSRDKLAYSNPNIKDSDRVINGYRCKH
jgi:undecaprenyl-diphosphatase